MTAGAVLAYAGLRGVSPLDVLRNLGAGKLPAVPDRPASTGNPHLLSDLGAQFMGAAQAAVGAHPEFVAAAEHYASDRYSEMMRAAPGYSDCSSFVCKAMRDCGVTDAVVAGWPRTTITLKTWTSMHQVDSASAGAGDLAISDTNGGAAHVVMLTGPGTAIGQQNSRENVQTGPLSNLMTVPYHIYRYTGASHSTSGPSGLVNV
jgi:cell wall-associated NlpC family hydrolase